MTGGELLGPGEAQLALPRYDVIIATRNRPDALELSLPLILAQEPAPDQVIIVDASDDPSVLDGVVAALDRSGGARIQLIRSESGLPRQRNRGLAEVRAPIVFLPDDDALWHSGFAQSVLEVYARDREGCVGGVGGREVSEMPELANAPAYVNSRSAQWSRRLTPTRYRIESQYFPEPLTLAARALMSRHVLPHWVDGAEIVAVEHVTGFRMSFRSEFVKSQRFDEVLAGYALSEDVDMSLKTWRDHLLLAHHGARVMHFKRPGGRELGWRDGYLHILNYAYVVAKHAPPGSPARRRLTPWALYRCAMYAVRVRSWATLLRFFGALSAVRPVWTMSRLPDAEAVTERFVTTQQRGSS